MIGILLGDNDFFAGQLFKSDTGFAVKGRGIVNKTVIV